MISKLKERKHQLESKSTSTAPGFNVEALYEKVVNGDYKYSTQNVKSLLEHWEHLDTDQTNAAIKAYDVLEQVYLNGNTSSINTFTHTFAENIVPKVRNGAQLQTLINRRLGQLKSKLSSKVQNKLKKISANNAVSPTVATAKPAAAVPTKVEEAVLNSFKEINDAIVENGVYDRIIANHGRISKRFNIDKYVNENIFTKERAKECVIELCKMIDTYDISEAAKYSIAIENILYLYDKNHIPYERQDILEMATNYFLTMTSDVEELSNDINKILEHTKLYTKADIKNIKLIKEDKALAKIHSTVTSDGIYFDEGVIDKLKSFKTKAQKTIAYEIKHFKLTEKKSPKTFSEAMRRAFANDDENIIKETPNVLSYVLNFFIVATGFAVAPIVGIITAITLAFLNIKWQREEVDKQIKTYEAHIKKIDSMIAKAKNDKNKQRLEEYKQGLETNLEKLKDYKEDLKSDTEKEDEEKEAEAAENEAMIKDIASLQYIAENCEKMQSKNLVKFIEEEIQNIPSQYLSKITEFAIACPDIIDPDKLCSVLENEYDTTDSLGRRSALFGNIRSLNSKSEVLESQKSLTELAADLYTVIHNKDLIVEALQTKNMDVLHELSIIGKIKMAKEKLKSAASDLHEKERAMSKGLDLSLDNMQNALRHSMDIENREAVIKNQLLPPASRIIKTAIVTGLAWCIHPALAAIVVLSTYVISKNARERERQIIIDELDVELNMCNRYIQAAESNNDLKKIRQLLTIKKKLEYEKDRLYYKMKMHYDEKIRPEHRHPDDTGGGE